MFYGRITPVGASIRRVEHPSVDTSDSEVADPSIHSCSVGGLRIYATQSFASHRPGEPGSAGCPGWPLGLGRMFCLVAYLRQLQDIQETLKRANEAT